MTKSPSLPWSFLLTVSIGACLCGSAWSQTPASVSDRPVTQTAQAASATSSVTVTIPGPLRSFLRMAAISQKASPEEVLPLLARNVEVEGFHWQGRSHKPTEYLILVQRYLRQSRELLAMAGSQGVIRVANCNEAEKLLTTLGYQLREGCGPNAFVETAEPERAFLTIDSGFPLPDLEEALREGKPFEHPYPASQVPVLFSRTDWAAENGDVVGTLLGDPKLARLYWALARIDQETGAFLKHSPGLETLLPLAPVLDFYGSHLCIRGGRVIVPGGTAAESAWKDLVGASPGSPAEFITKLLEKDEGWLAVYFDALSRAGQIQQAYFTEPHHVRHCYEALRGRDVRPGPAGPVFRPNPGVVLLASRLQLEANGEPHIPGGLAIWKEILRGKWDSKLARETAKRASRSNNAEQLIQEMFALSRVNSEEGPLQLYLTLNEMDRGRSADQRLTPQTVRLLAEKFSRFNNQYSVFCEFRGLNNASIAAFISVAEDLDHIPNRMVRPDALGIFQAEVGLWQILARQGQIPGAKWNDSWQRIMKHFDGIRSSPQLYDAARGSFAELLRASGVSPQLSQDEIVALLAGPEQTTADGRQVHQEMADKIHYILEAQRLVSLDTLFALGDGLKQMVSRKGNSGGLIRMAGELREFQMPKPLFTKGERIEWTPAPFGSPHTDMEMGTDLGKVIRTARSSEQLAAARGQVVPFLRDTLVGLNYAYYEPPGAQMLYNNPIFVRSHDFSGEMTLGGEQVWKTASMFGRGWTAGGGAHLAGSLADLPYVLAQVEQDFIVPENVQSLIWEDLVPCLVTGSVLPRWWRVSHNELHAVTLYQQLGEELVASSGRDEHLREKVMNILSDRLLPQREEQVNQALRAGHREEALAHLAPAEIFYLGIEFRRKFPHETAGEGKSRQELEKLAEHDPEAVSWDRLSEDFGVPHPALAQTYARELLPVKPFPTFLGYSSRLLAESWDSNNLYWARLADEMGYPPVMLNRLVPELTHRMVEKIFATHLEDWPALLRALRETGEEFRLGKIEALPKNGVSTQTVGLSRSDFSDRQTN